MTHPKPWRVEYLRRCPEWDAKSRPCIVDAVDNIVCEMPQHVDHPGLFDVLANVTAHEIVRAVNTIYGELARL